MTCRTCSESGIDHDDVVKKCLSSPAWVGRVFFDFDKLNSSFHEAISEWLVRRLDEGKNRFLVLVPRDHLKTTLFGISTQAWLLLRNPDERILYTMATRRESQKTLSVIQKAFMSERMKHFFPKRFLDPHHPDMKATRDSMVIARPNHWREANIEALGLDSNITGGHFTKQIFDDLIDATMKNSIVEQERAIDFLKDSTNLLVDMKNDVRIIIGTLWEGEFYDWLLYRSGLASHYERLILGCYVDARYRDFLESIGKKTTLRDGDPIWPEQFNRETLERIRLEQGSAKFSRQFLNLPTEDDYQRFRKSDFIIYDISPDREWVMIGSGENATKIPTSRLKITMVIDPATGEGKKSDETAISVTGKDDKTGFIFVLEDWAARSLPHQTIDQIFALAKKWDVRIVAPEDVSYQKVFKHFLKEEMNLRNGVKFSIRPVKPGNASKGTRIEGLEPYVRAGQVCVRKEHLNGVVKEAEDVVIVRGQVQGRSPNRLDALAYQTEFWGGTRRPPKKQDDIEEWDANIREESQTRAYGLACAT